MTFNEMTNYKKFDKDREVLSLIGTIIGKHSMKRQKI